MERAGLGELRRIALLAKSVAKLESMIDDPEVDHFAQIAAIKCLMRDLIAIAPTKAAGHQPVAQTPVTINIGDMPPGPGKRPKPVASGQTPAVIDIGHNAP